MGVQIKWMVSNLPLSLPKAYADTGFRLNELRQRILVGEFGKISGVRLLQHQYLGLGWRCLPKMIVCNVTELI